ncbi:MAG: TlpA family protein disulfide reductase [Actinoallomurus sp.]
MTRPRTLITAVIVVAVALTGAAVYALANPARSGTAATVPAIGRVLPVAQRPAAPRITGPALTGPPQDTSALGGVVVINIWGSWCVPCRAEAPILRQVALDTKRLGVHFIGIDIKDNRASAQGFTRTYRIPYPSIFDPAGASTAQFGPLAPRAVPSTFILDAHHRIAAVFFGAVRYTSFNNAVLQVARERP